MFVTALRLSVEPDVISFADCSAPEPEQALQLLREMLRQSVEPDVISFADCSAPECRDAAEAECRAGCHQLRRLLCA